MRILSVILFCCGILIANAQVQQTGAGWAIFQNSTPAACVLPTTNLVAHWTADSGITQSGGTVSAWVDTVASISLSQSTGANQPAYLATGYNSKPAIQLYGSGGVAHNSSWMTTSANPVTLPTNGVSTWFVVGQLLANTDAVGFGRFVTYLGNGSTADNAALSMSPMFRDGTNAAVDGSVDVGTVYSNSALTLSTNFRIGTLYDGTTMTPYVNNVAGTGGSRATTLAATGNVGIGGNLPTPAVWMDAIEREILVYNTNLSTGNLNIVDTYLTCNNGT